MAKRKKTAHEILLGKLRNGGTLIVSCLKCDTIRLICDASDPTLGGWFDVETNHTTCPRCGPSFIECVLGIFEIFDEAALLESVETRMVLVRESIGMERDEENEGCYRLKGPRFNVSRFQIVDTPVAKVLR